MVFDKIAIWFICIQQSAGFRVSIKAIPGIFLSRMKNCTYWFKCWHFSSDIELLISLITHVWNPPKGSNVIARKRRQSTWTVAVPWMGDQRAIPSLHAAHMYCQRWCSDVTLHPLVPMLRIIIEAFLDLTSPEEIRPPLILRIYIPYIYTNK